MLSDFVHHYGALGVALGAGLEGETAVTLGGALARDGAFSPILSGLGAWAGSFVADQLFFHLGRSQRQSGLVRRASARPVFTRAVAMIERHPILFCFVFRFMYGFRVAGPVALGVSRVPTRLFVTLNGVSAVIWAAIFTAIGYRFGKAFKRVSTLLRAPEHLVIGIAIVAMILALVIVWRRRHRRDRTPRGLRDITDPADPEAGATRDGVVLS